MTKTILTDPVLRAKVIESLNFANNIESDPVISETIEHLKSINKILLPEEIEDAPESLRNNESTQVPEKGINLGISYFNRLPVKLSKLSNIFIGGQTRTGKTVFKLKILMSLIPYNKVTNGEFANLSITIFDQKNDYLHLLKYFPEDIYVITKDMLKENPLWLSDETDPIEWLYKFAEIYCDTNQLGLRSKIYLTKILLSLFENYDKNNPPNMIDLKNLLEKSKPKAGFGDYEHIQVWRRVFEKISHFCTILEKQMDCSKGFPTEWLEKHNIIFSWSGLSSEISTTLTKLYDGKLFWYRHFIREKDINKKFNYNIRVYDEALNIFPKSKQILEGVADVSQQFITLSPEYSIIFIAGCQRPYDINRLLLSESACKVMFSLQTMEDRTYMLSCMGASNEVIEWSAKLPIEHTAIGKMPYYPHPFIISTNPNKEFTDKTISWDYINTTMKEKIKNIPIVPRIKNADNIKEEPKQKKEEKKEKKLEISKNASELLRFLSLRDSRNQYIPSTIIYKKLFKSLSVGHKAGLELIKFGFVEKYEFHTGARGGKIVLLIITITGYKFLNSSKPVMPGRGADHEHRYWVFLINDIAIKNGYKTIIEEHLKINNKSSYADISLEKNNKKICIEVVVTTLSYNNLKNIVNAYDKIIIAVKNKEQGKKIKKELIKTFYKYHNKIRIELLSKLLELI